MALALLPDADVALVALGACDDGACGHRGASHSLPFAIAIGLLAGLVARRLRWPVVRTIVAATFAVASHAMLDVLGEGGRGLPLLWPFSDARFISPIRIFPDAPRGLALLSMPGAINVAIEFAVFLPMMLYALWPRLMAPAVRRRRSPAPIPTLPRLTFLAGAAGTVAGAGGRRRPTNAIPDTFSRLVADDRRTEPFRGFCSRSGNLSPMIFGKEREAVRNATRAIRDLVLRPALGGSGGLGGRPGRDGDDGDRTAAPAAGDRDAGPGHAARSRRADDGDPGRPPARPALAFAAQALAGSVRYGSTLRERYLNLLAAAMDGEHGRPRPPRVPDGAAPADAG